MRYELRLQETPGTISRSAGYANQTEKICLISLNSRGFLKHKEDFFKFLLSQYVNGNKLPVLSNQENVVLKGNCYKIRKALPGWSAEGWTIYCCPGQN